MGKFFVRKCPFCSGDMLRAKPSWHVVYTPPWSGPFKIAGPRNRAYPWACMGCGVVLLYLDKVQVLAAEYSRTEKGRAELAGAVSNSTSREPLKS